VTEKILIVEDEPKLAALLADYMKASGFEVFTLSDGIQVEVWVRENKPNLIILDIMLPGRDGMEICKNIRFFSRIPIIMVTARVEEIDRLLGLELGADDYICKPSVRVKSLLGLRPSCGESEMGRPFRHRGLFLMNTPTGRLFTARIWN